MLRLKESNIDYTIYFYNPNIHPREEYLLRKNENLEFAYVLNLSNYNWSITDHNGLAPLPINTKLNDSLKIQRYGYETFYLLLKEDNTMVNLKVEPIEQQDMANNSFLAPELDQKPVQEMPDVVA